MAENVPPRLFSAVSVKRLIGETRASEPRVIKKVLKRAIVLLSRVEFSSSYLWSLSQELTITLLCIE
jgi:hypothetical protein